MAGESSHTTAQSDEREHDRDAEKEKIPSEDDEESQEHESESKKPVHFFHPKLNAVRLEVLKLWGRTTLILCVFILVVLSLYWAVLYHVEQNLSSLLVYVVDFDGQVAPYNQGVTPMIGPMIVEATQMQLHSGMPSLGFLPAPPSEFANDSMAVRRAVYDQKAWAAIIINANATALLQEAVSSGNTSYDPTGAAQIVYVEARDDTTHLDYVVPMLQTLQTQITTMFGEKWAGMLMQNASTDQKLLSNLQKVPQAVNPAIGFSTFNLRPFIPPTATPTVTIGLIYLIILSFFSFAFYLPIHMKFIQPQGHPPLHFYQLIIWRYFATIAAYFFISLSYSFISLAFQIPFSNPPAVATAVANNANAYHRASFFVYWMLNFVGMIALGIACENVAMVIGQPWTAMWLIFWVITNVSTSFYEITLSPRFYFWGYAWPLHNIVEGSRTILFDLHSRIGLNFGILFTWAAINTILFPVCCWIMRKNSMKGKQE